MSFLARLQPDHRARLDALGTELALDDGAFLVRRGDVGGDLYVVQHGALEVLDSTGGSSAILLVLEAGGVLGDVSFLDEAPRPADVRARGRTVVHRWRRDDLLTAAKADPTLAAGLYEGLARNLARNVRQLAGATAPRPELRARTLEGDGDPDAIVDAVLDDTKARLAHADDVVRARPVDPASRELVGAALDHLQVAVADLFAAGVEGALGPRLSRHLRRELRPWLARSRLADAGLHDAGHATVTPELIAHVLADVARGEGWLGTYVDRWLLDRPAFVSRRTAEAATIAALAELPPSARGRVLFLDALVPERLDRLAAVLGPDGGRLVIVDPGADALDHARARLAAHATPVDADLVREGVVQLALGRVETEKPPSDVALLFDLLAYLPDRIAISVLRWTADELTPDGVLLATNLEPSDDEPLLAQLLHWPTIRRAPARFERVVRGAGLVVDATLARDAAGSAVRLYRAS